MKQNFSVNECYSFAQQLNDVNYKSLKQLLIEHYDSQLLYQVSQLIEGVSQSIGNDFGQDEELYYNLVTHIQVRLNRLQPLDVQTGLNSLLETIAEQYEELFEAVNENFSKAFNGLRLNSEDIAFIVIHFATSYEKYPVSRRRVRLLLVFSAEINSIEILENRLVKALPQNDV
ncbi:PRD domain protein [Aerococcus christensenii]|uniref:PRD domain protein n=1 Tax=Aerococcus christensenii TaxID=87541 RepID=A0A133XR39_9LACT|nr:PRD domain protein [Aerococcus christensenii]